MNSSSSNYNLSIFYLIMYLLFKEDKVKIHYIYKKKIANNNITTIFFDLYS